MRKHFFNCTELVLVVFCAAVTAALTIAAAGSMANSPEVAVCTDVMKGIERRTTAWENDHGGTVIATNQKNKLWGRMLVDGGYFDKTGFYNKAVRHYPRQFECPAETRERSNGKVTIAHPSVNVSASYDYALNRFVYQPVKQMPKRSELLNASRQMRMTEAVMHRVDNKPAAATARHGKGAGNVVFADGHIEFLSTIPYKGTPGYNGYFWFNSK